MKHPIISSLGMAVLAGVSLITPALAVVNMVYVPVGNPGNAPDPATGSLYGSVGYAYNIGKYEVTNAQYCEFLNAKGASNSAGIYNSSMSNYIIQRGSSGNYSYILSTANNYANWSAIGVTWFDAARFCNWMQNGQGSGDTETGAYTLISGQTTGIVAANPDAAIRLPTENEWYKAAYYNGANSTYSLYPNGKNTITTADANYGPSLFRPADVGYGAPSSYGTYGQGGNAWEWNDAVINGNQRGRRGGSWDFAAVSLTSQFRNYGSPSSGGQSDGFRLVSVPEPTSAVLTMFASGMLLIRRKR